MPEVPVNLFFPIALGAEFRIGFESRYRALADRPDRSRARARVLARECGSAGMI